MTTQTETRREEERILRLDEALEIIPFLAKTYCSYRKRSDRYDFLDTKELINIPYLKEMNAEPLRQNTPQIVGQFLAVRRPKKDLLEFLKIGSHECGFFYGPLDALFNNQGFLKGLGKLKSELDHCTYRKLKEPMQAKLAPSGQIVSEENRHLFIDEQSQRSYSQNRGWNSADKGLEDISIQLPVSRNWTLGTLALETRNQWTATISEASPTQQIVLRYSGEPLESALMSLYVQPKDLGNGVITMSQDRIPLYLRRRLGLGERR